MAKKKESEVLQHVLIPKHEKLSDKEKKALFEKYNVVVKDMPKIIVSDPAILTLDAKEGDVIRITRPSLTSGEATFYRCVISE